MQNFPATQPERLQLDRKTIAEDVRSAAFYNVANFGNSTAFRSDFQRSKVIVSIFRGRRNKLSTTDANVFKINLILRRRQS